MLKPGGSLNFAVGNLSTAAAIGGPATGASFAAASPSGRPIMGDPGGNAGFAAGSGAAAAGGEAAGGAAGCCAAALSVNAPIKAPASNRRGADEQIVMIGLPVRKPVVQAQTSTRAGGFPGPHSPIFFASGAIGNMLG
jgi:hypothetical protein